MRVERAEGAVHRRRDKFIVGRFFNTQVTHARKDVAKEAQLLNHRCIFGPLLRVRFFAVNLRSCTCAKHKTRGQRRRNQSFRETGHD